MKIRLKSWRHLGDTACLSAAMANLAALHPDWEAWYCGDYAEMYDGGPFHSRPDGADRIIQLAYNDHGGYEKTASRGNVCESYTAALAGWLGEDIPCVHRAPVLPVPTECMEWAGQFRGCVLLNTNCQQRSSTKGYPHWPVVAKMLRDAGKRVALMGGRENRDIRHAGEFPGCADLRGRTTVRQLMALASVASCVASPASGIVHIAAAYGTPCVVVTGARELPALTAYPNTRHLTAVCHGRREYGTERGCMHFVADATMVSCEHAVEVEGRWYPRCMTDIPPEKIANAILEMIQ